MSRIVFMGTPEFAVPVLAQLIRTRHEIAGVYTRPDQPVGRGKVVQGSPVKRLAESHGLTVLQPKSLRGPEAIARLRDLAPDLVVVAAYGLILPPEVLAIPARGCINTHASLLPRYRGAAPIVAALLAGDDETGVTLMQMDAGLDTGPILAQRALPIAPEDTTGTLTARMASLAADLLAQTLPAIMAGTLLPHPQDESRATVFKTIDKQAGLIDWSLGAVDIERRVRAFNPWPSAFTFWNGVQLKILGARALPHGSGFEPGQVLSLAEGVAVATGAGTLQLTLVQLAGKRALAADDFIRGQRGFVGSRLTSSPSGA